VKGIRNSMKTVSMMQPFYLPWKGLFDMIRRSDVFVFYDDVQFVSKNWQSRNNIPTANGPVWLTVPVLTKDRRTQNICETEINPNEDWQKKHYKTLSLTYAKAPFFRQYAYLLEDFYIDHKWTNLAELDVYTTKKLCEALGISVEFARSSDYGFSGGKEGEKILRLCQELGCDKLINGPKAAEYMNQTLFDEAGISVEYMQYEYPEYRQLYRPFEHGVSVLDLLFNTGDKAPYYIWGWREEQK
jgi:hypothetical protein